MTALEKLRAWAEEVKDENSDKCGWWQHPYGAWSGCFKAQARFGKRYEICPGCGKPTFETGMFGLPKRQFTTPSASSPPPTATEESE